jgi:hypothetical protein
MSSAEHVKVKVIDCLAPVFPGVDHDPIALLGKPFFAGNPGREQEQVTEPVVVGRVFYRRNVPPGNDQKVRGRLGVDVSKRQRVIRFGNDIRGDLAFRNTAEDALLRSIRPWFFHHRVD